MARPRTITIVESIEELRRLESIVAGTPLESRVRAMRLIKERPDLTLAAVASMAGCSARTLNRWIREYKRSGLPEAAKPLAKPSAARAFGPSAPVAGLNGSAGEWLMEFLSTLSLRVTGMEWLERFRTALASYLGGVDRVTAAVNVHYHNRRGNSDPTTWISHHLTTPGRRAPDISVTGRESPSDPVDRVLRQMAEKGFPFASYRQPHVQVYRDEEGVYVGLVILWRQVDSSPIGDDVLARLAALHDTIRYLMADCAARHQCSQPLNRAFYAAFEDMANQSRLTAQEKRVCLLQLMGLSYKEIASELDITPKTVSLHLSSVHRKTKTQSHSELYSKYFSPRL